jgi:hypothetical protein
MSITITAEPRAAIPVDLVGVRYTVQPPKSALAFKLAVQAKSAGEDPEQMLTTIDEWIEKAFGKKQATAIRGRLDINHLMQLMEALIEEGSKNPTSSPPASPKSP